MHQTEVTGDGLPAKKYSSDPSHFMELHCAVGGAEWNFTQVQKQIAEFSFHCFSHGFSVCVPF